jgi:hypothetical protein
MEFEFEGGGERTYKKSTDRRKIRYVMRFIEPDHEHYTTLRLQSEGSGLYSRECCVSGACAH